MTPIRGIFGKALMTYITNRDFFYEIAQNKIAGVVGDGKFGRNSDIKTTEEDIWSGGGVWVAPTQARIHQISSTSLNDTAAGTGARTIIVRGLQSWSLKQVSEVITMNGTANVPTVNEYVIINHMIVLSKGSASVNVGVITAIADTDGTVTAQINPDEGVDQMNVFGIPDIQTAYFKNYYVSFNKTSPSFGFVNVRGLINFEPEVERTNFINGHSNNLTSDGSSRFYHIFDPPIRLSGPFIFKIAASGNSQQSDVSAGFGLLLIDNLL